MNEDEFQFNKLKQIIQLELGRHFTPVEENIVKKVFNYCIGRDLHKKLCKNRNIFQKRRNLSNNADKNFAKQEKQHLTYVKHDVK